MWLKNRLDRQARARIRVRLARIQEHGAFGDCRPVGGGVTELRFFWGPGHRVYFGIDDGVVILLGGGDKSTQDADVDKAKERWADYNA